MNIGTDGRIVTGQLNVEIPTENAGIGDLIYRASGGAVKVIGCGTAETASIIIGSTSYTFYGVIYGFVAGMAMIVSPKTATTTMATGTYPTGAPTFAEWNVLMRNGKKAKQYAQMNTWRCESYITSSTASQPSDGLLTSSRSSTPLTAATFDTDANAATKQKFGSWTEYTRQTLRILGAPGSPFGATVTGVKVHEFGRYMGRTYFSDSTTFPATTPGGYCYAYGNGGGEWWLPSMYELGVMLIDEHVDKVNKNAKTGKAYFGSVPTTGAIASCVFASDSRVWYYYGGGSSNHTTLTTALRARPVTLLKLT